VTIKINGISGLIVALGCMSLHPAVATAQGPIGPVKTDRFHVTFVRLGSNNSNGLLYEPETPGPNTRVAVVYPNRSKGFTVPAAELASRGYRVLFVTSFGARRGNLDSPLDLFEVTSRGITYMRTLPAVERVLVIGWGAGASSMTMYANVAANGPAACQGPEVLYPCANEEASGLAKPDGVILLDPGMAVATRASDVDPAFDGNSRSRKDLDAFAAANGYDPKTGSAKYSEDFRKRFFAAQSARNNQIIDNAVARLKLLEQGKDAFTDDEPMVVPGAVNAKSRVSLLRQDTTLLSHTKQPHTLLKADGSKPEVTVYSVRPATGAEQIKTVGRCCDEINYTVRGFLANDAIRTTKDFALTTDDVVGVDWKSSNASPPINAEGISAPTLVMTMTCFQFVVTSEIVYNHLAGKDKTFAAVEGAEHSFTPCKPEYGDTRKRLFDFIDSWMTKPGRF
jgi:hypothetical protein